MPALVLAALLAAAAIWLAVPPAGERRLTPRMPRSLPSWLTPVPEALGSRPRGLASGALAVAVALWSSALGWLALAPAAIVGVGAYLLLGRVTPAGRARRTAELVSTLPQVCDLLAVTLESGLPLRSATRVLADVLPGPLGEALAGVDTRVSLGADESAAWRELATEPGLEALGLEVARTVGSGIALARVLRGLAVDARREAQAAAEVRAKRVGVLSVLPLMLCYLPAFVLLGVVPIIGGIVQRLVG